IKSRNEQKKFLCPLCSPMSMVSSKTNDIQKYPLHKLQKIKYSVKYQRDVLDILMSQGNRTRKAQNLIETGKEVVVPDFSIALWKGKKSWDRYPISQFVCIDHLSTQQSFIAAIDAIKIPISVQEALKNENSVRVMNEVIRTLKRNLTWEIVDKPKDKKVSDCRWIYTMKYRFLGTLDQYKARLVAKGYTYCCNCNRDGDDLGIYTYTSRIDYEEMNTMRISLSLAAEFGWDL
ncbi:putative mitochondrial protein, partial [Mucuna pruriens]